MDLVGDNHAREDVGGEWGVLFSSVVPVGSVCDVQNSVVLGGMALSCGHVSAKRRGLEEVKGKVMEMPHGKWLDWLIGSLSLP